MDKTGIDIFPEMRTNFGLSYFDIFFLNGGFFSYKVIYEIKVQTEAWHIVKK